MKSALKSVFRRIISDEIGTVAAIGHLLLITLLGIGMIVGVDTFKVSMVQEMGDVAGSLRNLNQNYNVSISNPDGTMLEYEYDADNADDSTAPEDDVPEDVEDSPPPGITISPFFVDDEGAGTFEAGAFSEEGDAFPAFP